jgi:aminoglycoside phosphotransferase (APT) family kinase protein
VTTRSRPLGDVDLLAHRGGDGTGLRGAARRRQETIPPPHDEHLSVHRHSSLDNTMCTDEHELSGMIDWDAAGVGAAGIDLGSLRFDVTLLYGAAAAEEVIHGWEVASGRPAVNLADSGGRRGVMHNCRHEYLRANTARTRPHASQRRHAPDPT